MNKIAKTTLKCILGVVIAATALILILLIVFTVTEFRPDDVENLAVDNSKQESAKTLSIGDDITVMTWNTGYGALGETADFFMDGGESVSSSDEQTVQDNLTQIASQISDVDADIVMLQEVDTNSKRSYHIDELDNITSSLANSSAESTKTSYNSTYAENYKVLYVPYPIPTIGQVDCGIATLSSFEVTNSKRISLPCPFSYPVRLFNLKRCLMVNRIPIEGSDKELVIVNLHLEAYDDGEGKAAQTQQLKELLEEETQKGNYVIAGGDFNQSFSNYDNSQYPIINDDMWVPGEVNTDAFDESLTFVTDNAVPTCRSLDKPLAGNDSDYDNFQYYVIDGFIISDNLSINSVETKDLGFVNSDHNPIVLSVTLE